MSALGGVNNACNNVAIGNVSQGYRQLGNGNISLGAGSLIAGCGHCNVAIGHEALASSCCSCHIVAIGTQALGNDGNFRSFERSIAIGRRALFGGGGDVFYSNNIALGDLAMECNKRGCDNIAIGVCAMQNSCYGDRNVAVGTCALLANANGSYNTAVGTCSLVSNTCGNCNTALGMRALWNNTCGCANVAIGNYGLAYNITGCCNTAVGHSALFNNNFGSNNVALGAQSLYCSRATTGGNIGVGVCAGCLLTTGYNNTVIGSLPAAAACVSTVLIGAGACERIRVDDTGLYINNTCWNSTGYAGSQGISGYVGSQGVMGSTGYVGSQGNTGYTGSSGTGFTPLATSSNLAADNSLIGTTVSVYTAEYGAFAIGNYVNVINTTPGSTFYHYAQITNILYAGGFGWEISFTVLGSSGTPISTPATGWSIQLTGVLGPSGNLGYTGSQGVSGYTGSVGSLGYTGSQGDIGYTGSQGSFTGTTNQQVVITNTLSSTSSFSTNALYVAGGIGGNSGFNINGDGYLTGNLNVTGYVTGTSVTLNVVAANSATFFGDASGSGALYAGVVGHTPFAQTMIQATGDLNSYMEINVQNINAGAQASTDIVASADNVSESNGFIDMGITSSFWDGTQPNSFGSNLGINDGYLLVGENSTPGEGKLAIGTLGAGTQIKIIVAGTGTDKVTAIFNTATTQATSTITGALVVYGGAGVGRDLHVGGTVYSGGIALGSGGGSSVFTVVTTSSNTAITNVTGILLASGTITISLPSAAINTGKNMQIKNVGTGEITVACTGGNTIDGGANMILQYTNSSLGVVSDGTNWFIF
jgi:hypothetical protein